MAPTFGDLDSRNVVKALAAGSTLQLYRKAKFAQAGVTSLEGDDLSKYFQKGEATSIKRPRNTGDADDYDPRSNVDAPTVEAGYVVSNLLLEKLFTKGFPVYSHDADVATYIRDYTETTGAALRKSIDDYLYIKTMRSWSIPATGTVRIGANAPIQIVSDESSTGVMTNFSDAHLRAADEILFRNDVPSIGRYARLSPTARNNFLGDVTLVSGFAGAGAQTMPGTQIVVNQDSETDVPRRSFLVGGSNAITGQSAVTDLGDGTATETITASVADTTVFFADDSYGNVPLGAVRLTLGITGAVNPGVAVGKIARIALAGAAATAYGVVLRVDAAGKFVWLVPYSMAGKVLPAAAITTSHIFSIPDIGSVNTASHKEHIVYASRLLNEPAPGEGAVADRAVDPELGLIVQVFKGSYNIHQFKGGIRSATLMGAVPSDHRKAVLMLSQ
jgi:hypothetical protein